MYCDAMMSGRYGLEVQYRMICNPRFLRFERSWKKLGEFFDYRKLDLESAVPYHWSIVADTCTGDAYLGGKEPPDEMRPWLKTDHHQELADSVGYNTLWMYKHQKYIVYQLELITRPTDDTYTATAFERDIHQIYNRNFAELFDKGVLRIWPGTGQQSVMEQLNVEIDDRRWPRRIDPLHKLSWLAAGVFLLTHLHPKIDFPRLWQRSLTAYFSRNLKENFRYLHRFDIFTNYRMLYEAWMSGSQTDLTYRKLLQFATSRAHVAAMTASWDNDACTYYVHGAPTVTATEMKQLSMRDFRLMRSMGIDSLLLDTLCNRPQPHLLANLNERRRSGFLHEAMKWFTDVEPMAEFVWSAVNGHSPSLDHIDLPLFHFRKFHNPNCTYMEFRGIDGLKFDPGSPYKYQFYPVPTKNGPQQIIYIRHLHAMARHVKWFMDVAIQLGRRWVDDIEAQHPAIARRDGDLVQRRYLPIAQYLVSHYQRPTWKTPEQVDRHVSETRAAAAARS